MLDIINFVGRILTKIVNILDTKFFSDIPISFLDLFLGALLLHVIFTFVTSGYKELDSNFDLGRSGSRVSRRMSSDSREKQIVNESNAVAVSIENNYYNKDK